jgi:hypothetical protein
MNTLDMVATMVNNGALIPIDVATQLIGDGYDISSLTESIDGYSVEDLITQYEELYG